MGYSRYSDEAAEARVESRVREGKAAVSSYTADIAAGVAPAKVHNDLDPKGLVFRESRDSAAHPEAVPVILVLDETGSMGRVIRQIQKSVRSLMKLLVAKRYLPHPHIMVIGVGDFPNRERAPLQVSQFEADDKIEASIDSIFIEGSGGEYGQESYQNAAYVAAFKTRTDHFEKRGQRGYMFIFGDEENHDFKVSEVQSLIGTADERGLQPMTTAQVYEKAAEKYQIFFVLPKKASGGSNEGIVQHWQKLIGAQNVLRLEDENAAGECVAAQIGICEGTTDADGIAKDLTDIHGAGAGTHALIRAVTGSISTTGRGEALTRMPEGSLAVGSSPVEVERL